MDGWGSCVRGLAANPFGLGLTLISFQGTVFETNVHIFRNRLFFVHNACGGRENDSFKEYHLRGISMVNSNHHF
jgi:hypothetical protein